MFERWLVPALATVLSVIFFLGGIASVALLLFRTAIPCKPEDWFYTSAQVFVVFSLFVGAMLMRKLKFDPKAWRFVIALVLPTVAVGLFALAEHWNEIAQRNCIEQRDGS